MEGGKDCLLYYKQCQDLQMKYLWINRSNKPNIATLSEFFLSLATGVLIVFHYRFIGPMIIQQDSFDLQSSMVILIIISLLKLTYFSVLELLSTKEKKDKVQKQPPTKAAGCKLAYPGLIKAGTYLSIVALIATVRNMSTAIIIGLILGLCFWLNFCSKDSKIVHILLKGRNYSQDKIKSSILYILLFGSICLEPLDYMFHFQLHLEIFFMFTSVLLIFSYFFIQKLVLKCGFKQKGPKILLWQSLYQTLFLLIAIVYLALIDSSGFTIQQQFYNLVDNWWVVLIISILNTIYELVLWQHLKKVAFSQLVITLGTGLLWFNIYLMSVTQIDPKLYISVIIMLAVLLVNIGLISGDNLKLIQRWQAKKGKSKSKFRQFENEKQTHEIDQ